MTTAPDPAELVEHPAAQARLHDALVADGAWVHAMRRRGLNRHGRRAASLSIDCEVERAGTTTTERHVLHRTDRPPAGARELPGPGPTLLHWRHPHDPYLPGLPTAFDADVARTVLDGLRAVAAASGSDTPAGPVRTRSRRYRPTRRAVVSWRVSGQDAPALWVKLVGGRTPEQVARRAAALVARHRHVASVVPAPAVAHHDDRRGLVGLTHLSGRTLRSLLRGGGPLPDPDEVLAVPRALARLAPFPEQDDPTAYADVSRHVRTLSMLLPDAARDVERLGAVAATVGGPTALVHGDLHDGQLLVAADGSLSGVLDVDGVGPGLLAQDLGRLIANVEVAALREGVDGERVRAFAAALHERATALAPAHDIARGAVGGWLALATGPNRVQSPQWPAATRRRLDEAARWARSAAAD